MFHQIQLSLFLKNAYNFHCSMKEPWGGGYYLLSVSVEKVTDVHLRTTLLLNSGDKITFVSETVKTNASCL